MFDIRHETPSNISAREQLLDTCFGEGRFAKTSERLREGRMAADGLSLVITRGDDLVATVRLWNVAAGPGRPALLLGPLAVDPALQGVGIGQKLMREALTRAGALGHGAVLLVGDEPYYRRFGFSVSAASNLWLPGPYERARLLGLELVAGALGGAHGLISPTGRQEPRPDLAALVRDVANGDEPGLARAA